MFPESVLLLVAAATTVIKVFVDIVRISFPVRPTWLSPVLAVVVGPIVVLLLMLSSGTILTTAAIAQAIIAGILAGGTAIGVTETQKRAA